MQDQGLDWGKRVWLCADRAASMAGCHPSAAPKIKKIQKKSVVYILHISL